MIENDPFYNTIYEDEQEKCDGEARHVGKDAEDLKTMQESAMVQSSKWIARAHLVATKTIFLMLCEHMHS